MSVTQEKSRAVNQLSTTKKRRKPRLLLPYTAVEMDDEFSTRRNEIEHFIVRCYQQRYHAKLDSFLPYFLSAYYEDKLSATLGFQLARTTRQLFLEQYFNRPVEQVLSDLQKHAIYRNEIVEVGNLSSARHGDSQVLFILITAILAQAGYQWVVFTATNEVMKLLSRLSIETTPICYADKKQLADHGKTWGSYYDGAPRVVCGHLPEAYSLLTKHHVIGFLLQNYENSIEQFANTIRKGGG